MLRTNPPGCGNEGTRTEALKDSRQRADARRVTGPPSEQGPPGRTLPPAHPAHLNGHPPAAHPDAPGGVRPGPQPPSPVATDGLWAARAVAPEGRESSPIRRAAWFVALATVLLGGMLFGARGCAKALTGGDLTTLRREAIAATPPSGTEVHRAASLGASGTLPYIERVYAVPDGAAATEHYTTTFGAQLNLVQTGGPDGIVLSGGRADGRRRIGVRVDIRERTKGPRLVEPNPDTPKPAPVGTGAFVTVVLSTTSGG
jgi:hypothetical protein